MELWMSGEIEGDVGDAYREVMNLVEEKMNEVFERKDYGSGLSEWAFIAMIFGEHSPDWYEEVRRYHRKDKSAEFRMKIDHAQFLSADRPGRLALLCEALLRSLQAMEEMKINDVDVSAIRFDFLTVARINGWFPGPPLLDSQGGGGATAPASPGEQQHG